MSSSRAIVVLGMHRNGTSLLTRGLRALDVHLGHDFYAPLPDNPTGYWEDRIIQDLNDRILDAFGLKWDSIGLIEEAQWREADLEPFRREATDHLRAHFLDHPVWGFKDPRTILLLPFWQPLFRELDVDDRYIVAVRNPLSTAGSLRHRQGMSAADAHLLWLLHMVPHLHRIAGRPFVAVDYDRLMADPGGELIRLAERLDLSLDDGRRGAVEIFSRDFVQPGLRHHHFSPDDYETLPRVGPASREAYLRLAQLAADEVAPDAERFWPAWKRLADTTVELVGAAAGQKKKEDEIERQRRATVAPFIFARRPNFSDVRLFLVTGTQRTGTNLLREVLNTHPGIAMMGEVLTPAPVPGHQLPVPPYPDQSPKETASSYQIEGTVPGPIHPGLRYAAYWGNFLRTLPVRAFPAKTAPEAEALLDRYFDYLLDLVRTRWAVDDKTGVRAIGIDIKYTHLGRLAPTDWDPALPPFLLGYLRARGVPIIHALRRNVIQCAISGMIMRQTGIAHNYGGRTMEERITIDVPRCLGWAWWIRNEREKFLEQAKGFSMVDCEYDDLAREIARADPLTGEIPDAPGPLRDLAGALGVPFQFRYNGGLQKSINIPYSRLLTNRDELVRTLGETKFAEFAATLI
jgi:hypothetical protein